jgi:type 1 fimbria pilin
MKKTFATIAGVATLVVAFYANNAFADDKEVTVNGKTKCSACALHEGTSCNTVLQTKVDGKTVNYYLVENDQSKKLDKLSHSGKSITATGTVKEVDGKQKLTVSKFEVAKD